MMVVLLLETPNSVHKYATRTRYRKVYFSFDFKLSLILPLYYSYSYLYFRSFKHDDMVHSIRFLWFSSQKFWALWKLVFELHFFGQLKLVGLFQKTGNFSKPITIELVFQGKIHEIEQSVEHDMAPPAHEKKNFWLDASNSIWIHGSKCGLDFTFVTQVGCRVLVNTKTKNPPLLDYRYILCLVNFVVISIEVGAANFSKSFTFAYIYISTHFD